MLKPPQPARRRHSVCNGSVSSNNDVNQDQACDVTALTSIQVLDCDGKLLDEDDDMLDDFEEERRLQQNSRKGRRVSFSTLEPEIINGHFSRDISNLGRRPVSSKSGTPRSKPATPRSPALPRPGTGIPTQRQTRLSTSRVALTTPPRLSSAAVRSCSASPNRVDGDEDLTGLQVTQCNPYKRRYSLGEALPAGLSPPAQPGSANDVINRELARQRVKVIERETLPEGSDLFQQVLEDLEDVDIQWRQFWMWLHLPQQWRLWLYRAEMYLNNLMP